MYFISSLFLFRKQPWKSKAVFGMNQISMLWLSPKIQVDLTPLTFVKNMKTHKTDKTNSAISYNEKQL